MLQIDYRSSEALYIQIKNNFKKLIIVGSLREDDILPSVRNLASDLAINVNTVQRAYRELEQEGYIYSIPGKGNFVAKIDDYVTKKNFEEIENEVKILVNKAKILGIKKECVINFIDEIYEKNV